MSKTSFRAMLIIGAPGIIAYAYVSRLFREFGRAFWWARSDAAMEIETFRILWRDGPRR